MTPLVVTLTGVANINATGNALDNTLTGNAAGNTLSGLAGNDTLVGGAGAWKDAENDEVFDMRRVGYAN